MHCFTLWAVPSLHLPWKWVVLPATCPKRPLDMVIWRQEGNRGGKMLNTGKPQIGEGDNGSSLLLFKLFCTFEIIS